MTRRGPLLGFNDNVVRRGATFHVQTEDLGPRRRQVTTHLFADGGRIVHSERTAYDDLDDAAAAEVVRERMKEQHRRVIAALLDGRFDAEAAGTSFAEDDRGGYRYVAPRAAVPSAPPPIGEPRAASPSPSPPPTVGDSRPSALGASGPPASSRPVPSPPPTIGDTRPSALGASGPPPPSEPWPSPPPSIAVESIRTPAEPATPETLRGGFRADVAPTSPVSSEALLLTREAAPTLAGAPSGRAAFGQAYGVGKRLDELIVEFFARRRAST